MTLKHLEWEKPINNQVNVYNKNNEWLGTLILENVGRHRHWCWYQQDNVRMSPGCLDELRLIQKELFKERKQ